MGFSSFLYDLRHFEGRDDSRSRLEYSRTTLVVDASYINARYFEPWELLGLELLVIDDNGEVLEQLIQVALDEELNRRKGVERVGGLRSLCV